MNKGEIISRYSDETRFTSASRLKKQNCTLIFTCSLLPILPNEDGMVLIPAKHTPFPLRVAEGGGLRLRGFNTRTPLLHYFVHVVMSVGGNHYDQLLTAPKDGFVPTLIENRW